MDNAAPTKESFNSQSMALRVQKKLAGKMSSRGVAKHFISDKVSNLLDSVYNILKDFYDKKEAEKIIKSMIKTVVKIGLLLKNNELSEGEEERVSGVLTKFRSLMMTVTSFIQVDYSYERAFIQKQLDWHSEQLQQIVRPHLTQKSLDRIQRVFDAFNNQTFLDQFFRIDNPHKNSIALQLTDLMDNNEL